MTCKFAQPTGQPWFINDPDGAKTVRCYYPKAVEVKVAGGFLRLASIGDTIDVTRPVKPQIIENADYVAVRSCKCNEEQCPYYTEKENADDI